jgi:hypothetical protein
MSEDLPEPFVPPDIDVRDLDGFMLNVERLLASELWALCSGDEFKAAMALWMRAWKQVPGGSLPDDERVLAVFSGAGRTWPRLREMALRGFIKCNDGRLYHRVLCEEVKRAAERKKQYMARREREADRLRKWRSKSPDISHETHGETQEETTRETRFEERFEERFVAEDTIRYDTVRKEEKKRSPIGDPKEKRGTRLPHEFEVPPEWIEDGAEARSRHGLPNISLALEAARFCSFWWAKPGASGTKKDWRQTWINWCLNARGSAQSGVRLVVPGLG